MAFARNHTRANSTDYVRMTVAEAAKATGGLISIMTPEQVAQLHHNSQRVELVGQVVSETPDPSDSENPNWKPRSFNLVGETGAADAIPISVKVDIEGLNRKERQFIIDYCYSFSVTPCRATVLGALDEIVGERDPFFSKAGIVADEVSIKPVDRDMATADGRISEKLLYELFRMRTSTAHESQAK